MADNYEINTGGGAHVGGDANFKGEFVGRDKIVHQVFNFSDEGVAILRDVLGALMTTQVRSHRALFEQHIEPTFLKLESVHKDYERMLRDLRRKLREEVVDPEDLIDWLKDRGIDYRSEREYLKKINIELDEVLAKIKSDVDMTENSMQIAYAIDKFSVAVVRYFQIDVKAIEYKGSAYVGMIRLADLINRAEGEMSRSKVAKRVKELVDDFIDNNIPNRWQTVTETYLELRGLCLS